MTWLPDVANLLRPDLVAAAMVGAALALVLRRLLPLLALGLLGLLLWKPDLVQQLKATLQTANHSFDLSDKIPLAQFGIGFVTGFIVLAALFYVRYFAQAAVAALAVLLVYGIATEGVNGMAEQANAGIRHLLENKPFLLGLAAGKLCAGIVKWRVRRRVEWRP